MEMETPKPKPRLKLYVTRPFLTYLSNLNVPFWSNIQSRKSFSWFLWGRKGGYSWNVVSILFLLPDTHIGRVL